MIDKLTAAHIDRHARIKLGNSGVFDGVIVALYGQRACQWRGFDGHFVAICISSIVAIGNDASCKETGLPILPSDMVPLDTIDRLNGDHVGRAVRVVLANDTIQDGIIAVIVCEGAACLLRDSDGNLSTVRLDNILKIGKIVQLSGNELD